jgi:hypothetical protein
VKSIYYLLVIQILFLSCNNNEQSIVANKQDTVAVSNHNVTSDTTARSVKDQRVADDTDANEPDEILTDYVNQYTLDFSFDSTFRSGNDSFEIRFRHYCLLDSAVVVPGRYVKMYKLDSFVTHNFESSLLLVKNGNTVVKDTIRKISFNSLLGSPVKEYGVLQPRPYIYLLRNAVEINYSLSIPLTDLGKGVTALVGFDGKMVFKDRF